MDRWLNLKKKSREYHEQHSEVSKLEHEWVLEHGMTGADPETLMRYEEFREIHERLEVLHEKVVRINATEKKFRKALNEYEGLPGAFTNLSMLERMIFEELKGSMTNAEWKDLFTVARIKYIERFLQADEMRRLARQMRNNYNKYGGSGI